MSVKINVEAIPNSGITSEKISNIGVQKLPIETTVGNDDNHIPTSKAVRTYVDEHGGQLSYTATTDVFGVAKIKDGDLNGNTYVDGMVASQSHTHGQYSLTNHTHSEYSPISHDHNDLYFTKSEVNSKLDDKSDANHTHTYESITSKPTTFSGFGLSLANGTYISVTTNNASSITISSCVQALSSASAQAMGLAEASDVKQYIDAAVVSSVNYKGTITGGTAPTSAKVGDLYIVQVNPIPSISAEVGDFLICRVASTTAPSWDVIQKNITNAVSAYDSASLGAGKFIVGTGNGQIISASTYDAQSFASAGHTHNYAGSNSAGGDANNSLKWGGYNIAVVSSMPASPDANTIYFLK